MASIVDIYNMALSNIGSTVFVADLDERTNERRQCARFYETVRDGLLGQFPWPFARAFVTAANLGSPPTNWLFRYAYPNDCCQLTRIVVPGVQSPTAEQEIPFEIACSSAQRVILTNQPDAELEYTVRIESAERYPALFVDALAMHLAARIAMPLNKEKALRDECMQLAMSMTNLAMAEFLEESSPQPLQPSIYERSMH